MLQNGQLPHGLSRCLFGVSSFGFLDLVFGVTFVTEADVDVRVVGLHEPVHRVGQELRLLLQYARIHVRVELAVLWSLAVFVRDSRFDRFDILLRDSSGFGVIFGEFNFGFSLKLPLDSAELNAS